MLPTCIYLTSVGHDQSVKQGIDACQFFHPFSTDFQPALDFLMQDVSAVALLKKIIEENQGEKINLKFGVQEQAASYDFDTHTIILSKSYRQVALQEQVAFLFFELQNAQQRRDLQRLYNQTEKLGKKNFVKQIETREYSSALATHYFVNKYVNEGTFNKNVPYFYTPLNFKDHYLLQQLTGHAQKIAAQIDQRAHTKIKEPYHGTWPCPLTIPQLPILKLLLSYKIILETPHGVPEAKQREVNKDITEWMNKIDSLYHSNPNTSCDLWINAHKIFQQK